MGQLRSSHIVEAAIWLVSAAILYALSFKFDQTIEIYKFGASAWPRALLVLIVLGVLGQLFWQYRFGDSPAQVDSSAGEQTVSDVVEEHSSTAWYVMTAVIVALPFLYMRIPEWIGAIAGWPNDQLGPVKIIVAAVILAVFAWLARNNNMGAMLAIPLMFAAMMEDFGFYALAPLFAIGVMVLMGERRSKWIAIITGIVYVFLTVMFVKVLYVGLPTGNIEPFYTFGTTVVNWLQ